MKTSEVILLVALVAVGGVVAVQFLKPSAPAKQQPKKQGGNLLGDGLSLISDIAGAFGGGDGSGFHL